MIKINLVTRKQPVTVNTSKTGAQIATMMMRFDAESLKQLPLKAIAIAVVAIVMANMLSSSLKQEALAKVDADIASLGSKKTALEKEVAQRKDYEQVKKSVEADEAMIRSKLSTIQRLVVGRRFPPKLMVEISSGIPKDVWVSEMSLKEEAVRIKGFAAGFGEISDFIKFLNESASLADVSIVQSKLANDDTGHESAEFEIAAKRRTLE